jgi:hypothetical protein
LKFYLVTADSKNKLDRLAASSVKAFRSSSLRVLSTRVSSLCEYVVTELYRVMLAVSTLSNSITVALAVAGSVAVAVTETISGSAAIAVTETISATVDADGADGDGADGDGADGDATAGVGIEATGAATALATAAGVVGFLTRALSP